MPTGQPPPAQPPSAADPFGGKGPFDQYLDATKTLKSTAPQWDNGQQFNGYEGTLGKTLGVFNKFSEGLTQGRVHAFAMKEKEKQDNWTALQNYATGVDNNPNISDTVKASLHADIGSMWAKQQQPGLKAAQKDKGTAGHVAKFFGGVVDRMAGGPYKSGEPWDVKDVLGIMSKYGPIASSPESTVASQFGQVKQAVQAALPDVLARVQKGGFNVVTREDLVQHPEIQKAMEEAGRISAGSKEALQGFINSYPSGENPQIRARLEAAYMLNHPVPGQAQAPPSTRAESGMMPQQPGYYEQNRQALQPQATGAPAAAPQAQVSPDSVARLPQAPDAGQPQGQPSPGSVVRIPGDPGQNDPEQARPLSSIERADPPESAAQIADKKRYEELLVQGGIEKRVQMVTMMDPDTHSFVTVSADQAKALKDRAILLQNQAKIDETKAQNKFKNQQDVLKLAGITDFRNKRLSQHDQELKLQDRAIGIQGARLGLAQLEHTDATAGQRAIAKVIEYGGMNGLDFEDVHSNLKAVVDAMDDPEVNGQLGYITNQFSLQEGRKRSGNNYAEMMSLLGGGPPPGPATGGAAPPAARTDGFNKKLLNRSGPAPAGADRKDGFNKTLIPRGPGDAGVAVHPTSAGIAGKLNLGGPAPAPAAPAAGSHMVWDDANQKFVNTPK